MLSADEARTLLESIPYDRAAGLRDRALIASMLYTFGRVGAVIAMDVADYRMSNHQRTFLLHEKGGKVHQGAGAPQAGRVPRRLHGRQRPVG